MTRGPERTAAAAPPDSPAPRRTARGRFRARLDRDPRRWTLFLTATGGLLAPLVDLQAKREVLFDRGVNAPVLLALLAALPAASVLALFVQARLLLWTGKLLGGAARPVELHAAFAWAQLPLVLSAWPLLIEIPLRVAAADAGPLVAPALAHAIELCGSASELVGGIAAIAALIGAVRWLQFLAEAQRFSIWRAVVNLLMAGALLLGLASGGIRAAAALLPGSHHAVRSAAGAALIVLAVALPTLIARARPGRAAAA